MTVEIVPLKGMPEVRSGDDLAKLIGEALRRSGWTLADGDIVVVTQKAVSKAEGRVVPLGPGGKAWWVERETRRVVASLRSTRSCARSWSPAWHSRMAPLG